MAMHHAPQANKGEEIGIDFPLILWSRVCVALFLFRKNSRLGRVHYHNGHIKTQRWGFFVLEH
jgi:hypothetical protein